MDAAQLLAKVSGSVHVLMLYRLLLTPKLMMAGSGRKSLDNNDCVGCGDGFVVHDDMEGNEDDINDGNDAGDAAGDSMMAMMMMMMVVFIIIVIVIIIIIMLLLLLLLMMMMMVFTTMTTTMIHDQDSFG